MADQTPLAGPPRRAGSRLKPIAIGCAILLLACICARHPRSAVWSGWKWGNTANDYGDHGPKR